MQVVAVIELDGKLEEIVVDVDKGMRDALETQLGQPLRIKSLTYFVGSKTGSTKIREVEYK